MRQPSACSAALLVAADQLGGVDPFRSDLADIARQALADLSLPLQREVTAAWLAGDQARFTAAKARFLDLGADLDNLLATRHDFLPGLADACARGITQAEAGLYERNARQRITGWGPDSAKACLFDCSCRQWSGLIRGYYLERWIKFFDFLDTQPANYRDDRIARGTNRPNNDANDFYRELLRWEDGWSEAHEVHPTAPQGDSVAVANLVCQAVAGHAGKLRALRLAEARTKVVKPVGLVPIKIIPPRLRLVWRKQRWLIAPSLAAALFAGCHGLRPTSAPDLARAPGKWAQEIAALQARDRAPPSEGAVLFVGSSSIRFWATLAGDFPRVQVINHGFGGSELSDSVFYLDRIVLPFRPRVVVLYAGDNDLQGGKSPETVAADFAVFCEKIHASLPATRIIYVSIKPSPSRWNLREKMVETNARIAALCAVDPRRKFVDVYTPMLDAKGQPRPELFLDDKLHMNRAGYELWTKALAPLLGD